MMKKRLLPLLLVAMILTSCGEQPSSPDASSTANTTVTESTAAESSATESEDALSELEAIGSIEVEEQLFDVTLTIPKDYVGETTQDELNKTCKEKGFKSITLNEDGSATYVMTKSQHKDMMAEYRDQINASLQEMIASETYPNFTAIEANDNFTEFTVTTKSTELDLAESFSVMAFYVYGGMYAIFEGTEVDNISVTFINADTGKVLHTSNSSDMAE